MRNLLSLFIVLLCTFGVVQQDSPNIILMIGDGMGLTHLQAVGIPVEIISQGLPGAINHRAKRLGIKFVYTDVVNKAVSMREIIEELGIDISEVAHIGDDINDIPLFDVAGLTIAVTVASALIAVDVGAT